MRRVCTGQNLYAERLEEPKSVFPECGVLNRNTSRNYDLDYKALVADLLAFRLDATQVAQVLATVISVLRPDQTGFKNMRARHVRNVNKSMVRVAKTIGAIEMMECTSMFVNLDLMCDDQQEYGAAMLKCRMPDGMVKKISVGGV